MISIKQARKAEKLIGNNYCGYIMSVQSYGFFVELTELNVEGLVHVSTLNNDWYEYRSRQNLLIGRKSKKSYKFGDKIEVKIITGESDGTRTSISKGVDAGDLIIIEYQ